MATKMPFYTLTCQKCRWQSHSIYFWWHITVIPSTIWFSKIVVFSVFELKTSILTKEQNFCVQGTGWYRPSVSCQQSLPSIFAWIKHLSTLLCEFFTFVNMGIAPKILSKEEKMEKYVKKKPCTDPPKQRRRNEGRRQTRYAIIVIIHQKLNETILNQRQGKKTQTCPLGDHIPPN